MKSREVALRERQLLPLFVWLRRFTTSRPAADSSANLCRPPTTRDLVTCPDPISRFLRDQQPSLRHLLRAPGMTSKTLSCSTVPPAVEKWYREMVPRHHPRHLEKNIAQEISLCEHAAFVCRQAGFRPKVVVDLGGGNGILAAMLQRRLCCDMAFVVDRQKPPRSVDEQMTPVQRSRFHRVLKDMSDVNFRQDLGVSSAEDVLCVSKHLCGAGIDHALRSMNEQNFRPRGLCLSSCCHWRRQTEASYINPKFLSQLKLDLESQGVITPWIFDVFDAVRDELLMREYDANATAPRSTDFDSVYLHPMVREIHSFMLPLTVHRFELNRDKSFCTSHRSEQVLARQRVDLERKSRHRIARTVATTFLSAKVDGAIPSRRSRLRDPTRRLMTAIASRTNWISEEQNPWMRNVGLDLESVFDAGRVDFLRREWNGGYAAEMKEFTPLSVTPRNKVLLAWRNAGALTV